MSARKEILEKLIAFEQPLENIKSALSEFPWDSEEIVFLSLSHAADVLRRYLSGAITAGDVESWANAIETRDDVGFQSSNRSFLRELVHELANPLLTRPLTYLRGSQLLKRIEAASEKNSGANE